MTRQEKMLPNIRDLLLSSYKLNEEDFAEFDKIQIGTASDGQTAARNKRWSREELYASPFIINVAEPVENSSADLFIPLGRRKTEQEKIAISASTLDLVATSLEWALKRNSTVFIHCTAGLERSPLCVVWWLHTYKSLSLDDAYALVSESHPETLDRRAWITYSSLEESFEHNKK